MEEIAWPDGFDAFITPTAQILGQLEKAGWTVETVTCGPESSAPWLFGLPHRAVEITGHTDDSVYDGVIRHVRIIGTQRLTVSDRELAAAPSARSVHWVLGPTSDPLPNQGQRHIRNIRPLHHGHEDVISEIDNEVFWVTEPNFDPMSVLGDPSSVISVFSLVAVFVSAIVGKVGEDSYGVMKRLITRAPRTTRADRRDGTEWVVIHDAEYNTVVECPKELPAEAALQLARKSRDELTRVHLRWDVEACVWQIVGSIEGTPPASDDEPAA